MTLDYGNSPSLWAAAQSILIAEQRNDRSYDESGQSTLFMPNHSKVCSFDRAFLGAATAEILEQWRVA